MSWSALDQDAHLLVAKLHREALLLLSSRAGRHFQGLGVGSRFLRLENGWIKKLTLLDAVLGLVEKISVASCAEYLDKLKEELEAKGIGEPLGANDPIPSQAMSVSNESVDSDSALHSEEGHQPAGIGAYGGPQAETLPLGRLGGDGVQQLSQQHTQGGPPPGTPQQQQQQQGLGGGTPPGLHGQSGDTGSRHFAGCPPPGSSVSNGPSHDADPLVAMIAALGRMLNKPTTATDLVGGYPHKSRVYREGSCLNQPVQSPSHSHELLNSQVLAEHCKELCILQQGTIAAYEEDFFS
jgi:hypothetical protein